MKRIIISLICLMLLAQHSEAQDLNSYIKKYNLPTKPLVIVNIKSTDCMNCWLVLLNTIKRIDKKEKVIILFEDPAMSLIADAENSIVSDYITIYDSVFSRVCNNSSFSQFNLLSQNKMTSWTTEKLNKNALDSINTTLSTDDVRLKIKFNTNHVTRIDSGLILFNNKFQVGSIVSSENPQYFCNTIYDDSCIEEHKAIITKSSTRKLVEDSLARMVFKSTNFSPFIIKGFGKSLDSKYIPVSYVLNIVKYKDEQKDTNIHLALEGVSFIARAPTNSDIFSIKKFKDKYFLDAKTIKSKVYFPNTSQSFSLDDSSLFSPYSLYSNIGDSEVTNNFLFEFDISKKLVVPKLDSYLALPFWDNNPTEDVRFANVSKNPIVIYFNSHVIEVPKLKRLILLDKQTSHSIKRLLDFWYSGSNISVLYLDTTNNIRHFSCTTDGNLIYDKLVSRSNIPVVVRYINKNSVEILYEKDKAENKTTIVELDSP